MYHDIVTDKRIIAHGDNIMWSQHIQRQKPRHNQIVKAETEIETKTLRKCEGFSQRQIQGMMQNETQKQSERHRKTTKTYTDTVTGKGIIAHGENLMW